MIPLLANYQMLPQFLREVITDQAIASLSYTLDEQITACQQFYEKHQLASESERQELRSLYGMTSEELKALAMREQKIETFKRITWNRKVESYFLRRKSSLDKVIYSLIQTNHLGIAQELYFRLQAGEQSFAELARTYSQGPAAETGGMIGPIELGKIPEPLAQILSVAQPSQLWTPIRLEAEIVIVRLEKRIPVQLDASIRQKLLNELFEAWLQEELVKLTTNGDISLD